MNVEKMQEADFLVLYLWKRTTERKNYPSVYERTKFYIKFQKADKRTRDNYKGKELMSRVVVRQ